MNWKQVPGYAKQFQELKNKNDELRCLMVPGMRWEVILKKYFETITAFCELVEAMGKPIVIFNENKEES